jgi:hypothetical protein
VTSGQRSESDLGIAEEELRALESEDRFRIYGVQSAQEILSIALRQMASIC